MKPPKEVQQYLSNEKDRLNSKLGDISAQIHSLENERAIITNKLRALSELLEDTTETVSFLDSDEISSSNISRFQNIGIREAVLSIVNEHPNGIDTPKIANILKKGGMPEAGSTNMETRVSNELYKLFKTDRIRKIRRGFYAPRSLL